MMAGAHRHDRRHSRRASADSTNCAGGVSSRRPQRGGTMASIKGKIAELTEVLRAGAEGKLPEERVAAVEGSVGRSALAGARGPAREDERGADAHLQVGVERNPGMPLDLDIVYAQRVNRSAAERRAATIPTRRTVKKQWQAAWLLKAVTLMDLTTLSGDDTPGNVRRLCAKARNPVRRDVLEALGA